jgi:choline dehydrogenase-like flavoprotein
MAAPLPHDDATCGWYCTLPEPAPARRVRGDERADWVVLGAGVTGLAAARRLGELRPDDRILLIDAQRVGYGASGRNAGFILETPHYTEDWPREQSGYCASSAPARTPCATPSRPTRSNASGGIRAR